MANETYPKHLDQAALLERAKKRMQGYLPDHMDIEITALGDKMAEGRIRLQPWHLAPNGYLHAASVIALADTVCGSGTNYNLPEGARGFTTAEIKSNHLGTVLSGSIYCRAQARHTGKTTQVWDAEVCDEETGRVIELFRCTQVILWPNK